jgi:RNase adaptor protein for sRNA GlmZ degradation
MNLDDLMAEIDDVKIRMDNMFEGVLSDLDVLFMGDSDERKLFYDKFDKYISEVRNFYKLNNKLKRIVEEDNMEKEGRYIVVDTDAVVWNEFKRELPKKLRDLGYKGVKSFEDAIKVLKTEGGVVVDTAQMLLKDIKNKIVSELTDKQVDNKEDKFKEMEKELFL